MPQTQQVIQNRKDAQKAYAQAKDAQVAYAEAKKQARQLTKRIERAIADMPAACENWVHAEETQYLVGQLREITDRLCGEGEYAR